MKTGMRPSGLLRWSHLRLLSGRFGKMAMVILAVFPFVAEAIGWFGLPYQHYRYPVCGAILFLISCAIYGAKCPKVVSKFEDEADYQNHCLLNKNSLDFFNEFEPLDGLTPKEVRCNGFLDQHLFSLWSCCGPRKRRASCSRGRSVFCGCCSRIRCRRRFLCGHRHH